MNETVITQAPAQHQLLIRRAFDAPRDLVWKAWTDPTMLDRWWAPEPWKAETKHMDFREGGQWLYSMNGPEGERHWSRVDFLEIDAPGSFEYAACFADEHGNKDDSLPAMHWRVGFKSAGSGTEVEVRITFDVAEDLEKLIEMGFREGFAAAHRNLDRYLETQFMLRRQGKRSTAPRVTTYLNFPGNTEEAFHFYKEVFNGEFTGAGLQRFSDIDLPDEHPPMSEEDMKLIIHAELTIAAGHVLMATDAPESMGFKLESGNNMHINIKPGSREEAKRLFDALSEGGKIDMPLKDMFFGAYFGSFTDKYGINWMINHQTKN